MRNTLLYTLETTGCVTFCAGIWFIYWPAALIAAGILAVLAAAAADRL